MKKSTPIILIILAAAGYLIYRKFKAVESVKLAINSISFGGKILSPKVFITLSIKNPSGATATINSFLGSLFMNGKQIANVDSLQSVKIAANGETLYKVTATPSALGILSELKDILSNGIKSGNFILTGTINVDGNIFPVNTSYKI